MEDSNFRLFKCQLIKFLLFGIKCDRNKACKENEIITWEERIESLTKVRETYRKK